MAFPNRFPGWCATCALGVRAGAGFYEQGVLTCTETVGVDNGNTSAWLCLPAYNRLRGTSLTTSEDARLHERALRAEAQVSSRENVRLGLVNGFLRELATTANVRSLEQVISKVTGAPVALADLTWEQAVAVRQELDRRIDRKTASERRKQFKATDTCTRCGGAGRGDQWAHTGYTCYQCGGTGKYSKETAK